MHQVTTSTWRGLVFFTLLANIFYILSYCGLAIFNKVRVSVSALFGYCYSGQPSYPVPCPHQNAISSINVVPFCCTMCIASYHHHLPNLVLIHTTLLCPSSCPPIASRLFQQYPKRADTLTLLKIASPQQLSM